MTEEQIERGIEAIREAQDRGVLHAKLTNHMCRTIVRAVAKTFKADRSHAYRPLMDTEPIRGESPDAYRQRLRRVREQIELDTGIHQDCSPHCDVRGGAIHAPDCPHYKGEPDPVHYWSTAQFGEHPIEGVWVYVCNLCGQPIPKDGECNSGLHVGPDGRIKGHAVRSIDMAREREALTMRKGEVTEQRDTWIRLFNRLEAAITHHKKAKHEFDDDTDQALYAARDRILRQGD